VAVKSAARPTFDAGHRAFCGRGYLQRKRLLTVSSSSFQFSGSGSTEDYSGCEISGTAQVLGGSSGVLGAGIVADPLCDPTLGEFLCLPSAGAQRTPGAQVT